LVTCGGTIGMTERDGVRVAASTGIEEKLLSSVTAETITVVEAGYEDSAAATPATWEHVIKVVRDAHHQHPTHLIVITHGTDTMAWTAGALAVAGPWSVSHCVRGDPISSEH
jgi:L-asparaginase/Glu-tRNA(Gln) amidotransferase subunit D